MGSAAVLQNKQVTPLQKKQVTPLRDKHVVVVGAGVGGLVSALLLAHQGVRVTLIEAAGAPGGKMRQINVGGALVDSGPTVFTMRWVFEQIFAQVGCNVADVVKLEPLDILCRHAWGNTDQRLDLFTDVARSADAIAQFSSPEEAKRFKAFCQKAREIYQHLEGPYIRSSRPNLMNMGADLGASGLAALASLGPFASLWQSLGHYFHDPRLRQLFGRYATYCGASPWAAPATLMLVAHVELDGVWSVDGGMHALAKAIAGQAERQGATLRYASSCKRILVRDGRACGVELADGEQLQADAVVFNGDASALAQGLLGEDVQHAAQNTPLAKRSLSAVTWSVNAKTTGFPLVRHNVFFDDDYKLEFDEIFKQHKLPSRGTVYVCAQDRNDTAQDLNGNERLLCLVNAPPTGDQNKTHIRQLTPSEIESCQEQSLKLLGQCGLLVDLSSPAAQSVITTPQDFNQLFPGTGGALYGPASHGWMTPFQRPSSASKLPGLYLAGGSVHPGPGVPMAALSGQLAAATVLAHLTSTKPLGRVRISGGMSMPSATTASTP
jgi:1-hydroxycarotenoid 3,4-desaturase